MRRAVQVSLEAIASEPRACAAGPRRPPTPVALVCWQAAWGVPQPQRGFSGAPRPRRRRRFPLRVGPPRPLLAGAWCCPPPARLHCPRSHPTPVGCRAMGAPKVAPPSPERPAAGGVTLAPAAAAELLRAAAAVSPAALAPVLAAGVPVNVADAAGMTALHLAAKCGSPVGPLIAAGAPRAGAAGTAAFAHLVRRRRAALVLLPRSAALHQPSQAPM